MPTKLSISEKQIQSFCNNQNGSNILCFVTSVLPYFKVNIQKSAEAVVGKFSRGRLFVAGRLFGRQEYIAQELNTPYQALCNVENIVYAKMYQYID